MTDKDLITQLREAKITQDLRYTLEDAAADRIEALVKERDAALALLGVAADNIRSLHRAEAAEAKLAKAVEALRYYAVEALPWDDDDSLVARTALAELDSD